MGRHRKTKQEFKCLDCIHCRTRVFRKEKDLISWCGRKTIKPNRAWIGKIKSNGKIRLVWCEEQTGQFNSHGLSPRNASPSKTIASKQTPKKGHLYTNPNMKVFISDEKGACPFREAI